MPRWEGRGSQGSAGQGGKVDVELVTDPPLAHAAPGSSAAPGWVGLAAAC